VREARGALDGIDVAVLSAGVGGFGSLVDMAAAEWDRVIGVNLRGAFLSLREVGRAMVSGGRGGSIVAVGSISGFLTERMMGHYSVSKAGLNELTRLFADDLRDTAVLVNAVCPGWTATDMGGGGRPVAEGAASVVWAVELPDGGPTGGFFRDGNRLPW